MLAIYDWFGYDLPIKDRYRLIKAAGFDGILMWWSDGFDRGDYRSGPQLAREAGLFIENIHTPIQNQNNLWLDNLAGEALADCYLQCVADCAEFEIPTMVVHLPNDDYPHNRLGLDRIKMITEKAEQLGVNVALENLRNFTNLTYVLEQVDSKRVGFCYDCCHHNNYCPDTDLLSLYGSRLMALHLHDNSGEHNQHRLPFDGRVDWSIAMKKIVKTGYSGATALEPMNWDYQNLPAEEFLQRAYERAKGLEALRSIAKMIERSEKAQEKFAPGTSQHTLGKNRIKALYIASALIGDVTKDFTEDELEKAVAPIASLINKSEKAQSKLKQSTWQYKMLEENLNALHIASPLLSKALKDKHEGT